MNRKPSPKSVRKAVDGALYWPVFDAVLGAASTAVFGAVYAAVDDAVYWAVNDTVQVAVLRSNQNQPLHPNLHRFLTEVRQARGDAT